MLHCYPINDEQPHPSRPSGHDLTGTCCWCQPRVEWADPATGEAYSEGLVIHNSADCRELVEEAERIKAGVETNL